MIQGRKLAITAPAAARATASIPHQPSGFLPTCGDPTLTRDLPFRNVSSTKEWGSQSVEDVLDSALQRPKSFWKCLQHRCKSHGKLSGVCNTVASISKSSLAVAARYPRRSSGDKGSHLFVEPTKAKTLLPPEGEQGLEVSLATGVAAEASSLRAHFFIPFERLHGQEDAEAEYEWKNEHLHRVESHNEFAAIVQDIEERHDGG